jgi:hypothetical protein
MLSASCHCDAVRLEIDHKPQELTECNCSICRRYGARWAYYHRRSVRVLCAPGALSIYSWGPKVLEFNHCKACGCVLFHEATEKAGDETPIAVNAPMLPLEDVASIRVRLLDGASTWKYLD